MTRGRNYMETLHQDRVRPIPKVIILLLVSTIDVVTYRAESASSIRSGTESSTSSIHSRALG